MYRPKIGVIGCGLLGCRHSATIKKLDNFEIAAFADIRKEAAENCYKQFSAKYYCEDYKEILGDKEIEAVFVCTTHDSHYPIAMDAISAGKHVFMEKPLAMTVGQCEQIKKALDGTGLKFMVGHNKRFAANVKRLKDEIRKPVMISAQMVDNRWDDNFWAQDPVRGGGNVLSQGCHIFDIVTYIAGDRPDAIHAEGGTLTHSNTQVIDNIVATVKFKNGVIASVTIGDAGLNGFTSKNMVQVFLGNGCICLSNNLMKYSRYMGDDTEVFELTHGHTDDEVDPGGSYGEVKEFHRCIVEDKAPSSGVEEGTNAVKMVYAAFRSIQTGCVQKMD